MATRFMRIDLSDEARDFRPIALEPGLPLLDRSSANAKILFRWLGGMVAEPVWEGDSVSFFVRDDYGGRLEDIVCQPATAEDLQKTLKGDLAALKDRLEGAKPDTPTERALRKMIRRCLDSLTEDPQRTDLDCYFFRYRDVQGRWRLVWAWGYQRVDEEPAPAVICTDPECGLLFVRRPGQSPKCPSCEAGLAARPHRRRHGKLAALLAVLLLLLVAALVYWYLNPERLIATPDIYTGPVGSRVEVKIERVGLLPMLGEDVTSQAVGVILDPAVARFDQMASAATIAGVGKTLVRFHLGNLTTDVNLIGLAAKNPESISIEPGKVELAVGTTARLKLVGHYPDGTEADLTEAAQWTARNDGIVYSYEGLLEGLAKGETTVTARYRADPESKYLEAAAEVSVAEVEFKALRVEVDPQRLGVGGASDLRIDAIDSDDRAYSVLESSLLDTDVRPGHLATVAGRHLKGRTAGSGKLAATFGEGLNDAADFEVVSEPRFDGLIVTPEKLDMVVGEITDLNIVSGGNEPVLLSSPDPAVVEVTAENRLIARGEGAVKVEVAQGNKRRTVDVSVTAAEFASIAVDPVQVAVPVDDSVCARVLGRIAGEAGRNAEIAPDLLACRQRPSPRYAEFDPGSLELRGVMPTAAGSPQTLTLSFGKHEASAPVEVLSAPLRLALTPGGPVDLPLGQQARLQGWATYSGGRRVQVPQGRLTFGSRTTEESVPGVELRGDKVAALKPNAGPLWVYATYLGRNSKAAKFSSVEADQVALHLDVDRTLRLVGETGQAILCGTGLNGDVDLVPDMAEYETSDPGVLAVDQKTGGFRAAAPGEVMLSGRHAAASEPATLKLNVYNPAKARLVFEPGSLRVAVDQVARLQLYLEVQDGEKVQRAALAGPGVGYAVSRPKAIRWSPPILTGIEPAEPFDLRASYYPILSSIATAKVEVLPAAKPQTIRIIPSYILLIPAQRLPLQVQQQSAAGADQWEEIRPDAVAWTVPPGLPWAPVTAGLRPTIGYPEGTEREFQLQAEYGGKQATALVKRKKHACDPSDPEARVLLLREPEGKYLPVGAEQRYSIVTEKEGVQEPATDIDWPDDFENEYVRWQAPVLTAKRAGHQQWLRAAVDGRSVLFYTWTYRPSQFRQAPQREDRPLAVKILSDQGPLVRFPVGAVFDDFRVEAHYPDGFTRLVTEQATLRTAEPADTAPLAASEGRLLGIRPGRTAVRAEFDGVACEEPLHVEVTASLDVDQIRIVPASLVILPGESAPLEVVGYKDGKAVGTITGLGQTVFRSGNPEVARVDGSLVTGVSVGQTSVTAQLGSLVSAAADVSVVDSMAAGLTLDPQVIRLHVGQSARIGTDVRVLRGNMDLSGQCAVTPALPDVVRYAPEIHSLVGASPGVSAVAFTFGDKLANLMVEVLPAMKLAGADIEVVVEPATGNLAPGQALDLRVLAVSPEGYRIDRTASAVLSSSDPAKVAIQGNGACALATGTAEVTATIPETEKAGKAYMVVNDQQITGLIVEPPQLAMSTGDVQRLEVLGQAASGTYPLFPQPDLKLTPAGPSPESIRIVASAEVGAVKPGEAAVAVDWQGRLGQQVPVQVTDTPLADLQIEPARAVIHPGQPLVYQVTGLRGGLRRVLRPEDGVELFVTDGNVAEAGRNLAVLAKGPGHTAVVARLGPQQAEASLDVTPGTGPGGGDVLVTGPGGVTYYGPGGGYWGSGRQGYWHDGYRYWNGDRWIVHGYDDSYLVDDVYLPPPAAVTGLRFSPQVLRLTPDSPPVGVRVLEVLADGSDGRDVTADAALEVGPSTAVISVEKTDSGPVLRPLSQGESRLGAKLGTLTADPLLVYVGGVDNRLARLLVAPDPLVLWPGETATFDTVLLDPGGAAPLRPIDYRIVPPPGQGIVAAAGDRAIRGLSEGTTQVTVTATDPGGAYDGLGQVATVSVTGAGRLWIEPGSIALKVGQATPPLAVMTAGADGLPLSVAAPLQTMDPNVVAPESGLPGRFVAKGLGATQIRAAYRGREAFADVAVTGDRFVRVNETFSGSAEDFDVTLEVLAAGSEGPLEYRVYVAGEADGATWVPAEKSGEFRRVVLRSPRLRYGPQGSLYSLVIEARDPQGGPVQRYPFTFRLKSTIERTDSPAGIPEDK